jgi:hypothetical protein
MDCSPYLIEGIRALSPGYFNLVERQHVDELLRERQIATLALNTNAAPAVPGGPPVPQRRLASLKVATASHGPRFSWSPRRAISRPDRRWRWNGDIRSGTDTMMKHAAPQRNHAVVLAAGEERMSFLRRSR